MLLVLTTANNIMLRLVITTMFIYYTVSNYFTRDMTRDSISHYSVFKHLLTNSIVILTQHMQYLHTDYFLQSCHFTHTNKNLHIVSTHAEEECINEAIRASQHVQKI